MADQIRRYLDAQFAEHSTVVRETANALGSLFENVVETCLECIQAGNKLLFFGNGGSAADAQHFATELVVRYRKNRRAIPALALTTDTSALTAIGNDFGFDDVFARQVDALCRKGDVAIGISTSGNSENVIRGLEAARRRGAATIALTGGSGGRLQGVADFSLIVPSNTTARIQELHLVLGHTLCALLEQSVEE